MSVALLTTQKASVTVGLDDGHGNVSPLGLQFHWSFANGKATLAVEDGAAVIVALAEGTDTLHVTTLDGTVATDIDVTVTLDTAAPALVVTFGAPVAK